METIHWDDQLFPAVCRAYHCAACCFSFYLISLSNFSMMKVTTTPAQVKITSLSNSAVTRFEAEVKEKIRHHVRVMSLVQEVNNEQDKAMVSTAVKESKALIKKVGAARKAITAPLQQQIKQWIDKEKELLQPVEEAIHNADKLVQDFNDQIARQQQEMLNRIAQAEAEELRTAEEKDAEQVRQESEFKRQLAQAQHQTDGIRKVWAFELQDLSQVPREYLVLDEKKVRQAIRSGERAIPGLRIFQQQQTVYR